MYGAFSIGLALTIGILFVSKLSLGAFNPAVAVALWAKGAIKATTAIVYIIAEIIFAILCGSFMVALCWGKHDSVKMTNSISDTIYNIKN